MRSFWQGVQFEAFGAHGRYNWRVYLTTFAATVEHRWFEGRDEFGTLHAAEYAARQAAYTLLAP